MVELKVPWDGHLLTVPSFACVHSTGPSAQFWVLASDPGLKFYPLYRGWGFLTISSI